LFLSLFLLRYIPVTGSLSSTTPNLYPVASVPNQLIYLVLR